MLAPFAFLVVAPALVSVAVLVNLILFYIVWSLLVERIMGEMARPAPSPIEGWLKGLYRKTTARVTRFFRARIGQLLGWVPDWFRHLTIVVTATPNELKQLSFELTANFHRLGDLLFRYDPKVPERLWGAIPRHTARLERHTDQLEELAGKVIPALRTQISDLRGDLFRDTPLPSRGWILRLGEAIDSLRARLFDEETGAIRVLQRQMEAAQAATKELLTGRIIPLEHVVDNIWQQHVIPLKEQMTGALHRIGQIELFQSNAEPYIGAMTALWAAPAFRAAMETLHDNEQKMRRTCQLDLDEMDDLLGYVPLPLNLAFILEVVAAGAVTAAVVGELSEKVLDGETIIG